LKLHALGKPFVERNCEGVVVLTGSVGFEGNLAEQRIGRAPGCQRCGISDGVGGNLIRIHLLKKVAAVIPS